MERNVTDIMSLGWTVEEIRTFDSTEQKELARTGRKSQMQSQTRPLAMGAALGTRLTTTLLYHSIVRCPTFNLRSPLYSLGVMVELVCAEVALRSGSLGE
jgi:hypothetical protein